MYVARLNPNANKPISFCQWSHTAIIGIYTCNSSERTVSTGAWHETIAIYRRVSTVLYALVPRHLCTVEYASSYSTSLLLLLLLLLLLYSYLRQSRAELYSLVGPYVRANMARVYLFIYLFIYLLLLLLITSLQHTKHHSWWVVVVVVPRLFPFFFFFFLIFFFFSFFK